MAEQKIKEHKLSLSEVLSMLVADGMISQTAADTLIADRRLHRHDTHPLSIIAAQNWKALSSPHKPLHAEALTEWLAGMVAALARRR